MICPTSFCCHFLGIWTVCEWGDNGLLSFPLFFREAFVKSLPKRESIWFSVILLSVSSQYPFFWMWYCVAVSIQCLHMIRHACSYSTALVLVKLLLTELTYLKVIEQSRIEHSQIFTWVLLEAQVELTTLSIYGSKQMDLFAFEHVLCEILQANDTL